MVTFLRELIGMGGPVRLAASSPRRIAARDSAPTNVQAAPTPRHYVRQVGSTTRSRGLTPARVSAYLRQAADGDPAAFCELMDEVLDKDGHLVSTFGTRCRSVANLDWSLVPASDRARDRRVAARTTELLQRIDNFEDGLLDLLDAIMKGFAAVECDWTVQGGEAWVQRFQHRPQQWLLPDEDDPESWRVLTEAAPSKGEPLEPSRWVVHTARAKPGWPVSSGLGRVCVWLWLFKSYGLKDWVAFSEMFGSPLRVGKHPAHASDSDVDALETALQQLGVDAYAVLPEGMNVEFITENGRGGPDVYERLVRFCNREMSKAVLGQTLTTEESDRGTQALGKVHNDVRQDIVVADAKQLARTLTRQLVAPLVRLNFGDVPVPRLEFDTEPPADEQVIAQTQEARGRVFKSALELGLEVSVGQVREELGIREPTGGEDVLEPPEPAAVPFPFKGRHAPSKGHSCPSCTPLAMADRGELPAIWRQLFDLLEEPGQAMSQAWADLAAELGTELENQVLVGEPDAPSLLAAASRTGLLEEYSQALTQATLRAELLGQAQVSAEDETAELPELAREGALAAWAAMLGMSTSEFEELEVQHTERAQATAQWATLGATKGMVDKVERAAEKAAAAPEALPADVQEARLEAVRGALDSAKTDPARTEQPLQASASIGWNRGRSRQQDRERDRKPYFLYSSALLPTTRDTHKAMHGYLARADHPIWQTWRPPNGWGCYCWITAYRADELDELDFEVREDLPINSLDGRPLVPDPGWVRDHSREEHEYDWSAFPREWRVAIGAPLEEA